VGLIVVKGDPEWQSRTQDVYVQTTAFRDVFVSLRTFGQVSPTEYSVELQSRILPFVSFVWLGAFLMVMALLPLGAMEFSDFRRALMEKDKDLYGSEEGPSEEELPLSAENE
jgi:cytochrome c biogenesis factor